MWTLCIFSEVSPFLNIIQFIRNIYFDISFWVGRKKNQSNLFCKFFKPYHGPKISEGRCRGKGGEGGQRGLLSSEEKRML